MKKRVLITTGIFPPDIGGPATFLSYLAEDLGKAGFDVSVLTFGDPKIGKYSFLVKKVRSKLAFLWNIFLMARKADIIYSQDLYTAGFCSYLVKKVFPKKRLVVRFVGDSAWEKSVSAGVTEDDLMTFNQKKYDIKTERLKEWRLRILRAADHIITVSEFLKKVLLKMGNEGEIKVIYNSVDFLQEQFDEPLDKKKFKVMNGLFTISESTTACTGMCASCGGHSISTDSKIILTIARLVKWKGIEALIEIMPDLVAKYGDVKLVVLGDGPERGRLENMVIEEETKNIVFLKGRVEHRKTLDYLKIADVFVLNTNYEGLSHTLLEAMSLGVPIITTPAGGNIETIENQKTGFLVEFNDKKQLKLAIGQLLENQELAKTFAKNAKKSLAKFNWERLVKETKKILNIGFPSSRE